MIVIKSLKSSQNNSSIMKLTKQTKFIKEKQSQQKNNTFNQNIGSKFSKNSLKETMITM